MPRCCDDCNTNETPYTQGFRAGIAWERKRLMEMLAAEIEAEKIASKIEEKKPNASL